MGEQLKFKQAEAENGTTAYEASAEGVTYRVVGRDVTMAGARGGSVTVRRFWAFRLTARANYHPAGKGGEHRTRKEAIAQAEADLVDVLAARGKSSACGCASHPIFGHEDGCRYEGTSPLPERRPEDVPDAVSDARSAATVAEVGSAPLQVGDVVTINGTSPDEWIVERVGRDRPDRPGYVVIGLARPGGYRVSLRRENVSLVRRRPGTPTRPMVFGDDLVKHMIREFREGPDAYRASPETTIRMVARRFGIEVDL